MSLSAAICRTLCEGFSVREVPVGYAIKSPFDWFMGEPMTFYARVENGRARYEDSGVLIADLEGMGVDFESAQRNAILQSLLDEYSVVFDETDMMFVTEWVQESKLATLTPAYLAFLARVQDLLFLNKDRVASTFREDLISELESTFKGRAEIEQNVAPISDLPQSIVDITVSFTSGKKLAIFPATSELKAYQAMLFASDLGQANTLDIECFLIFENFDAAKVGQNTKARALNSNLQVAAWNGGKSGVMEKLERHSGAIH